MAHGPQPLTWAEGEVMGEFGLWTQAGLSGPHQLERGRRPKGRRAREGGAFQSPQAALSNNNRYQMIISLPGVGAPAVRVGFTCSAVPSLEKKRGILC